MSQTGPQMALWLMQSVHDCLAADHEDNGDADDRVEVFFRTVSVVLGSENLIKSVDEIESITPQELRSVIIYLKSSKEPSFQDERIRFILNIMQAGVEAAINYDYSGDSNKRKR